MNVKQYLNQVKKLDMMIENKKTELEGLESVVTSISIQTDAERIQSSGSKDRLGDTVARIVDLKEEIKTMLHELIDKKAEIIKVIEAVEDADAYKVLYCRYIKYMTYEEIAGEIHFTRQWVTQIHKRALEIVARSLHDTYGIM
jgi:DNA-directed RNA polymerase specialized sigma subunit